MSTIRSNAREQFKDAYGYDDFTEKLRITVIHLCDELVQTFVIVSFRGDPNAIFGEVCQRLRKEFGTFELWHGAKTAQEEVWNYFLSERDVAKCLDVIKTIFSTLRDYARNNSYVHSDGYQRIRAAIEELNGRFQQHCFGYEFRDGQMIRIDSRFLHSDAVKPVLQLLEEPYLAGANEEFLRAHEHYRHQRFPEALNECLKAFESTMKAICDKRGWDYNQTDTAKVLLGTCEKRGLFPAFMQSSLSGLRSVLENVATFRNKLSAHGQGVQQVEIPEETATFILHATAANILFLGSLEKKLR